MAMKFNSRDQSRIWFNTNDNTMRFVLEEGSKNHTQDVLNNPALFGVDLSKIDLTGITEYTDYDGRILLPAMKNGWVRSALNIRNPQNESNIEGINEKDICIALKTIDDFVDKFNKVTIIIRYGTGKKDGKLLYLINREDIDYSIKWGRFQPHNYFQ